MLPSDMLVVRTRKGKVKPVLAELNEKNLRIASELIGLFKGSIGRTQGEIKADIDGLETSMVGVDYRFIRGLRTLLTRRCEFEVKSVVPPQVARRKVFEEATKVAYATTADKRRLVLEKVARRLDITAEELENSLWADNEDRMILRGFQDIPPEELLLTYNLSITQTLLFKATSMEISVGDNYQRVFRKIKRLGLMYICEKRDGKFYINVEGPLALFKMTEKYGTAMAKLLPEIVGSGKWEIKANIIMRGYDKAPRSLILEMDSRYNPLLNVPTSYEEYDSSIEEKFAKSFVLIDTGWELIREPEPLIAGKYVFIPDFQFKKREMKVYMEVVGFWTEDYLRKKLYKLQHLEEENLIIVVDKKLACSKFKELKGNVIYYEREVPIKEILKVLRRFEEKAHRKDLETLSKVDITLRGDVVSVSELARRYNVAKKSMIKRVKEEKGYVLVGKELLSREKIKRIRERLEELHFPIKYVTVEAMLKEEGISSINSLLSYLGYKIEWQSLNPHSAKVMKSE